MIAIMPVDFDWAGVLDNDPPGLYDLEKNTTPGEYFSARPLKLIN
jgi:hypothetical protein